MTDRREPRTEAGRALVFMDPFYLDDVIRIEDEAPGLREAGLREALDVVANLQMCLRRFGAHRPRCSTVRVPGHKTCDCGLVYAIAKYAPPTILRAALATEGEP